jgi:hypothetical protein
MTQSIYTEEFAEVLGSILANQRREIVAELGTKIAALEARIEAFSFKGAWTEGKQYKQGNFVSHGGAIFHCELDTTSKPGSGAGWVLAVARGRDGRDSVSVPEESSSVVRTVRTKR